jgi:hypothetical protein
MKYERLLFVALTLVALPLLTTACRPVPKAPVISFTLVPVADPGGPESLEPIRGAVQNGRSQDHVLLYSYSADSWWVQPFAAHPYTDLRGDLSWQNSIHLGRQYAALLVDRSYKPAAKLEILPAAGNGVLAIATTPGTPPEPVTIHFSGYDWDVRQLSSNWGGKLNPYDPGNAWVDAMGFLHLRIVHRDDRWFCADVGLKESLGHGSYSFVLQDVSHLDPAAVLRLYTWDHFKLFDGELGVDISRFGDPDSRNSQFVVHPSYEPHNIHRFETPPGVATFSFRWQSDNASFEAASGRIGERNRPLAQHVFTSGIPQPAQEKIHISFYVYGNSHVPMSQPGEVTIERFQYLP